MARSINSPGVQITETDLSNYQQTVGGTTVLVPGFAPQGPTDEVLLITTASELEQVYGAPTTPAERYFFYSAKEILNSPATLLTTRLPYGSGNGAGFANQYSALLYPVASGDNSFSIGQPTHITLTDEDYNKLIQNNFTWGNILSGNPALSTVTVFQNISSVTATPTTSAATQALVESIDPSFSISVAGSAVTFTFDVTLSTTTFGSASASFTNNVLDAGIVIINNAQTTQNEFFEGYYVALADNTGFGADTDFTAVNTLYGLYELSGVNTFYNVPSTRVGFALSGTQATAGTNSISETIEFIPRFPFNSTSFKDSLVLTVFKIRNSIYEPQLLTYTLQESYIGSLNSSRLDVQGKTFYLESKVNTASPNVRVLVNPNISVRTDWSSLSSADPSKTVTVASDNKALYPVGVYLPEYQYNSSKEIGSVNLKVERALSLVDSVETVDIDIVTDGGLSTVFATASGTQTFDDTVFVSTADLSNENSSTVQRWKTVFNTFNNFVQNTRKDCMFIADPLRQIFVNGPDTKTLSVRGSTFSTNVYTPLKTLVSSINTNYAALYGNWVKQYDGFADKFVWLPSSGYVAAIYCRTDDVTQPWIAPAGLTRGIINNIVDLGFNPNQKQRDYLYTISINPIVSFARDGFVVFGQKTLQNKPSAFDRVNVRRLFLTLERATQRALKYYVFETNTEFTRTRLKNSITPIFELAKNTEGLFDYLIVCDERNNTPDVIDRNELAVDIYIKPVKAAEFILVNFIATRTGQNFQELI